MAWKRIGADIRTAQGRWVLLLLQHLSSAENEHCHGKRARPTSEWESPNRQLSKQVGAAEHKNHRCRASGIRISRAIHRKHQRRSRQCIASPSRKRTNPGRSSHRSLSCSHCYLRKRKTKGVVCVCAKCVCFYRCSASPRLSVRTPPKRLQQHAVPCLPDRPRRQLFGVTAQQLSQ